MKMKIKRSSGTRVMITAIPETHNGRPNRQKKAYAYEVLVHEPFENIANKESFAGFSALNIKDGKWKRFRMDRIVSMVQLDEKEAA